VVWRTPTSSSCWSGSRQYGIIAGELIAIGHKPQGLVADLMIASVAAANRLPLLTTNPDDFRGLDAVVPVIPVPVPAGRWVRRLAGDTTCACLNHR
jgi:predicted nucleic acid-binding protein